MRAVIARLAPFIIGMGLMVITAPCTAENLRQVYREAVNNDQTLKISLTTLRETAEESPQAWALLFPQINAVGTGTLSRTYTNASDEVNATKRKAEYGITLDQAIFDAELFSALPKAHSDIQAAYAAFKASQQDLISRTIAAYLDVLEQEDLVNFAEAEERALYEQYREAEEGFKVGVRTITEVYQAKAAYDGATSRVISAKNALDNAFEALSVITGKKHQSIMPLSEDFPLIPPSPANIDKWVAAANSENATVREYYYLLKAAKYEINLQQAGHLPTVNAKLEYAGTTENVDGEVNGNVYRHGPSAELELKLPIFTGGLVTSEVRQAIAEYETARATLELNRREQVQNAREAYLAIISGISQVKADRRTIISDKSSVDATIESYKVGTQSLTDVLDAEQQLYQDLSTYATDRYAYVNAIISLKEAAGTLNSSDVMKLNRWIVSRHQNDTALERIKNFDSQQAAEKYTSATLADPAATTNTNRRYTTTTSTSGRQ